MQKLSRSNKNKTVPTKQKILPNQIDSTSAPKLDNLANESQTDQIKTMLKQILTASETIQQDVYFIKTRYIKPINKSKNRISKEERKSTIINKMLTRGKRTS